MKWNMLITAALIGTSSMATVAAAQPADGRDAYQEHRRYDRYDRDHRDHRDDRDDRDGRYSDPDRDGDNDGDNRGDRGWQPLVGPVAATGERQFVHLTPRQGWMRSVRLDVISGAVYVSAIGVQYADHTVQKVYLDRSLDHRGDGTLVFEIAHPNVQVLGFVVYTPGRLHGQYVLSQF